MHARGTGSRRAGVGRPVQATAPDGYDTVAVLRPVVPELMPNVLVERFQVSARVESTDVPAYVLTLAHPDGRLGPRMKAEEVADCAAARAADQAEYEASGQIVARPT